METKSRKMKFTDLKDMLNQTGEVYGDRALLSRHAHRFDHSRQAARR